jgi:hypothetical protein
LELLFVELVPHPTDSLESTAKLRLQMTLSQACFPGFVIGRSHRSDKMLDTGYLRPVLASSDAPTRSNFEQTRRNLVLAPLLGALPLLATAANAGKINPSETLVTVPDAIEWSSWIQGFPPHSGQMATLYGGLDKPGPYVVYMKWYPGYMSAPHTYATDRLSVVLSGTWWVNSGADFDPANAIPVPVGGFVRRIARTPHYDGVMANAKEPAVIALFGIAPVDLNLVDPTKPAWRRV